MSFSVDVDNILTGYLFDIPFHLSSLISLKDCLAVVEFLTFREFLS